MALTLVQHLAFLHAQFGIITTVLVIIGFLWVAAMSCSVCHFLLQRLYAFLFHKLHKNGLKGGWAVVTGASYGLGESYSKQLASMGLNVCLVARSADSLQKIADECMSRYKVQAKIIVFDLSKIVADYNELYAKLNEIKDIRVLINNAGVMYTDDFNSVQFQSIASHILVNMVAPTYLSQYACRLKPSKSIDLVNISSISSIGFGLSPVYCGTKSYLLYLSKCLQIESKIVNTTCICPGGIQTQMNKMKMPFEITAVEAAKTHLCYLGARLATIGNWKNYIQYIGAYVLLEMLPISIAYGLAQKMIINMKSKYK